MSNDIKELHPLILQLANADQRESALLELSKKREAFPDLAPVLWHSFGTIAALLQEIISIYPMLSPPTLSPHASNRVCNALALLQCVASHPETKSKLMNGKIMNLAAGDTRKHLITWYFLNSTLAKPTDILYFSIMNKYLSLISHFFLSMMCSAYTAILVPFFEHCIEAPAIWISSLDIARSHRSACEGIFTLFLFSVSSIRIYDTRTVQVVFFQWFEVDPVWQIKFLLIITRLMIRKLWTFYCKQK